MACRPGQRRELDKRPILKSICIDCGMCSDGTIYSFVSITEGDQLLPLRAAGAVFVPRDDKISFSQPCPAFRGGCCSIYENRPAICREYRCALLRRYEAGEVSFEEARALITRTMALRDRVRPALTAFVEPKASEPLDGLYRLMMAKFEAAPDPAASRRGNAEMLLDIAALRVVLAREFEPRASDTPTPDDGQKHGLTMADVAGDIDRARGS